jgi:hypothetical protein
MRELLSKKFDLHLVDQLPSATAIAVERPLRTVASAPLLTATASCGVYCTSSSSEIHVDIWSAPHERLARKLGLYCRLRLLL